MGDLSFCFFLRMWLRRLMCSLLLPVRRNSGAERNGSFTPVSAFLGRNKSLPDPWHGQNS